MSKLKDHVVSAAVGAGAAGLGATGALVAGAGVVGIGMTSAGAGVVGAFFIGLAAVDLATRPSATGTYSIDPQPRTTLVAAFTAAACLAFVAHLGVPKPQKPSEPVTAKAESTLVVEENCQGIRSYISPDGKTTRFVLPEGCKQKPTL